MVKPVEFEHTKQFRNLFKQALDNRSDELIYKSLHKVNVADIASLLCEFNSEETKYVLNLLDKTWQVAIIAAFERDARAAFLKNYQIEELVEIISLLDSDDAVDIINEMPTERKEEIVARLDKETRSLIIDLLSYDENVAGGLMAKELIKANVSWTVAQCIEAMRKQAEEVDKFYTVHVVDNHEKLLGTVPLHKLILTRSDTLLQNIYHPNPIFVRTYQDEAEVAETMRKYDLETIPVVNTSNLLVGRITFDDVVDGMAERAEEERQMMTGISEDVEEHDSVWQLTRARLPWLLVGIIGGLISVQFIGFFEGDLLKITAIAFFIPLIQATSGNVGIQSSSIVVQSLANPGFVKGEYRSRLSKVFTVAILNGLLLSLVVLGLNMLLGINHGNLFLIVSLVLFIVVLLASLIGTATPLILDKIGLNPALASGPFITTVNDLLGLGVYLLCVHLLL